MKTDRRSSVHRRQRGDHRQKISRSLAVAGAIALSASACSAGTTTGEAEVSTPENGGDIQAVEEILNVTLGAEAPTLDWHRSTAGATQQVAINIFETLYAVDREYAPVPMLASGDPTVSDDGLLQTIELRSGVTFHNGDEMTAKDVVASLDRWGAVSPIGQSFYEHVDKVVSTDDYTVEIHLVEPHNDLGRVLAVPVAAAAIMPASVIEEVGEEVIEDDANIVGTGPFRLEAWSRGSHYELARFEDYTGSDGEPSGLSGAKDVTLAGVKMTFNPDPSSRLAGVETGQFDFGLELPGDFYQQVTDSEELNATVVSPFYSAFALLDTSNPPFDDPMVRKAAQLAIDVDQTMDAMIGHEAMYELSGAIYPEGMDILYTESGTDDYRVHDPDRAAQLLEESSYDGEEIVYMTTQEIEFLYDAGVAITQNLEEAGFNVHLDVSEWAEVVSRIGEPDTWDVFGTAFGVGYIIPSAHLHFSGFSPYEGWYARDDTAREIVDRWAIAQTDDERQQIMDELQAQFFEDMPAVKLGDYNLMNVTRPNVVVESHEFYWPTFWTIHKTAD